MYVVQRGKYLEIAEEILETLPGNTGDCTWWAIVDV